MPVQKGKKKKSSPFPQNHSVVAISAEKKGGNSSIIGNVLTFYKENAFMIKKFKWNFLTMLKRNKMLARTI